MKKNGFSVLAATTEVARCLQDKARQHGMGMEEHWGDGHLASVLPRLLRGQELLAVVERN